MKYLLIIEGGGTNLSAFFPDVQGCIVTGDTVEAVKKSAQEALEMHLEDEEPPMPRALDHHVLDGLTLDGTETIAWVNYERQHALA